MYATLDDLVCRYGELEIAKRADDGRLLIDFNADPLNIDFTITEIAERIDCALKDACADLNNKLACCIDMDCLKRLISEGETFSILVAWHAAFTRYYLHEDIVLKNCQHIAALHYDKICKEIEKLCDCGCLISDSGKECQRACKSYFKVAKRQSCIPSPCEVCKCTKCCCGVAK